MLIGPPVQNRSRQRSQKGAGASRPMLISPRTVEAHRCGGLVVSCGWDAVSNRTSVDTWWGRLSYGYDPRNLNTAITDPGYAPAGVPGGTTNFSYDPRGLLVEQDLVNGTKSTLAYDANRRLTGILHTTGAGAEIDHAYYGYDLAGNPLYRQSLAGTASWGYDALNQLQSENHWAAGLTSWSYDAARRRLTQNAAGAVTTYGWDAADQLQTAQSPSGTITNSYDP